MYTHIYTYMCVTHRAERGCCVELFRDMTSSHVWHDSFLRVTWLIHMCALSHSYVCQGSFIRVPCYTGLDEYMKRSCAVTWLLIHVTSPFHMCVMTLHMSDMTHAFVWQDSCMCVTWLMHVCDKTDACVWHETCMCLTWNTGLEEDVKRSCAVMELVSLAIPSDTRALKTSKKDKEEYTQVTLLFPCDMQSYVWHDLFLMRDMTHTWHAHY